MQQRRTALITGGVRRVGRAIALLPLDNGFDVAVTYFASNDDAIDLQQRGVLTIRADFFQPSMAVAAVFDAFTARFDRLDMLVNNASAYLPARLAETSPDLLRHLHAIHVEAPLLLTQRFEPLLREARGSIINMVDLLAEKPWPEYLAYCTSKAALANLTLGLARSLAPDVTVNAIAPGVVDWPDDFAAAQKEQYLKRVPLGRAGSPEDVARLVHFLCTGGKYITGQIIRLDGGRSIM